MSVLSLLLTCIWSCRCCSADDETLSASSSQVMQDLPSSEKEGNTDMLLISIACEENPPLHHTADSVILRVTSTGLSFGSCEAKNAQSLMCAESWQFKGAEQTAKLIEIILWKGHEIIFVAVHVKLLEEIQNRNDLVVEFLWDTSYVRIHVPHSFLVFLTMESIYVNLTTNPSKAMEHTRTLFTLLQLYLYDFPLGQCKVVFCSSAETSLHFTALLYAFNL